MRQVSLHDTNVPRAMPEMLADLQGQGVQTVRITYSDIHGIARGKDVPLRTFPQAVEDGLTFCQANLADGLTFSLANLANNPGAAIDPLFPDMRVRPLPATLVRLPWEPTVAWCLAVVDPADPRHPRSVRGVLERAVADYAAIGLQPIVAAELEFYLLRRDAQGRLVRSSDELCMVYTTGERADPHGVVRELVRHADQIGLQVLAAHHECGAGQYEINLHHGDALDAADRAFRFKHMVKEVAAGHGLLATFMGKPLADDAGSGLHLHVSVNDAGGNAFGDAAAADGLSQLARHFLAGVLEHAPALTAFCSPTINSYKRIVPGTLVPTAANWGYDNRTTYVRVPPDRGRGTRLEIRTADAAANPYLVIAACLFAGLDGIRRVLVPPDPLSRDATAADAQGTPLPGRLEDSLAALQTDTRLVEAVGRPLVDSFCALKSMEAERYRRHVSEWEVKEYAWHL
jgi:glutamine synthetase